MIFILLIFAVLLVIFTLQNQMEITIQFLFWEIKNVPFVIIVLGCFILGYLLSTGYLYPKLWKTKRNYKRLVNSNEGLKRMYDEEHSAVEEVTDPEGIKLDDSGNITFFKD